MKHFRLVIGLTLCTGLSISTLCRLAVAQSLPDGRFADGTRVTVTYLDSIEPGKYWIGLGCQEATETLRRHLKIASGGLVVTSIMQDSAATKAGLQEHDILVAANGVSLAGLKTLIEEVQKVEAGELKLNVIRDGMHIDVVVHPQERPAVQLTQSVPNPQQMAPHQWLDQFQNRGWFWLEPGHILPHGATTYAPIPPGVQVTVTRENGTPAKIHVKRGDEEWDLTEGELSKLPPELRGPVNSMINQQRMHFYSMPNLIPPQSPMGTSPGIPAPPKVIVPPVVAAPGASNSELQQLREAIRKLTEKVEALEKRE